MVEKTGTCFEARLPPLQAARLVACKLCPRHEALRSRPPTYHHRQSVATSPPQDCVPNWTPSLPLAHPCRARDSVAPPRTDTKCWRRLVSRRMTKASLRRH